MINWRLLWQRLWALFVILFWLLDSFFSPLQSKAIFISELYIPDLANDFKSTDTFSSIEPDKKNTKEENYKMKIRQTKLSLSKTLQHPEVPLLLLAELWSSPWLPCTKPSARDSQALTPDCLCNAWLPAELPLGFLLFRLKLRGKDTSWLLDVLCLPLGVVVIPKLERFESVTLISPRHCPAVLTIFAGWGGALPGID